MEHRCPHAPPPDLSPPPWALATAAAVLVGARRRTPPARADNVVTIKAEGTDLSGTVKSKRRACKDERKVLLVKQKGAKRGGATTR